MLEVNNSWLKKVYKPRKKDSYKGNYGKLLVIGGSKLYHGSPTFSALAAYRAGVDLVFLVGPERAMNIAATYGPELITYPLTGDYLASRHIPILLELSSNKDAIVIGGGMMRNKNTLDTIVKFLEKIDIPCVIDADAIYAISKHRDIVKNNFILTPHAYEFFILSGMKVDNLSLEEKIKLVKQIAFELNCTILLKGNIDIISDGNQIAINKTGNPFMTVGGTGDVLAGVCGALLARKIDCFTATCVSTYIVGKAGDIVAKEKKEGLLPSDIINAIPKVIK
jgi:NAD(P)H-hydrate epimerase